MPSALVDAMPWAFIPIHILSLLMFCPFNLEKLSSSILVFNNLAHSQFHKGMACSSVPIMAAVVTPATTTLVHHSFLNQRSFSTGFPKHIYFSCIQKFRKYFFLCIKWCKKLLFILGLNKCWIGPRFSELKMAATVIPTTYDDDSSDLSRSSFPKGFVFGTASSAYQVCLVTFVCYCACANMHI